MKAIKKGQYKSSEKTVEGNKREILSFLRDEALIMRDQSRQTIKNYEPTVHALHGLQRHISKIVNLASFAIKKMDINKLLPLMNEHGVITYTVE